GQESLPLLNELMKPRPHHFLSDSNLIVAVARTGDASAAQQLMKVLADSALHDSENEYYEALVAYYSGKTNETRGKLAALAEAPGLSSAQLQRLAALCDEQKLFAERVKILNRIASGGYGEWTRWGALAELVNTHVKSDPGWKTTE